MKRAEVTEKILTAKRMKELSWEEIAKKIGGASKIIVTAACMGQMKMTKEQATKAGKLFGLGKEETLLLQEVPYRGSLPQVPPTDPLIYRFYELVQVYGTTWKELIQEEFGDGIMSAIDFDMTMERQPDQKGDRVKIAMSGKFLGYKTLLSRSADTRPCRDVSVRGRLSTIDDQSALEAIWLFPIFPCPNSTSGPSRRHLARPYRRAAARGDPGRRHRARRAA